MPPRTLARQIIRRAAGAAILLALAAIVWRYRDLVRPDALRALLAGEAWAPLAFIALHMVGSVTFVPRTVFAVAGGLLFGLWYGILWTTCGVMAGAILGFLVARMLGGGLLPSFPRLASLVARLERGGWRAVAVLRLVPVMPHTPVNFAFGLTAISLASYAFGSFVGLLPMTLFMVDVGAAGGQIMAGAWNWLVPSLVGLGAIALSLLLPRLNRA